MKLVNLNDLKALHNLSTKEIEQAIEGEEDLCAICVEEGDKYYAPGEETRASGLKCISSVRWGAMSNWYVKNTEDIPTGWRIIQLAQSPFERAISGNLRQFRLVKPWIRKTRSTESYGGSHSLGWHDSLYGHLG